MRAPTSVAASLALTLAAGATAFAQYVGPSNIKSTTVAEVLKSGTEDQHVALRDVDSIRRIN